MRIFYRNPDRNPVRFSLHSLRSKMAITFFAVVLGSIFLISGVLYNKFALVITTTSNSTLMNSINITIQQLNSLFNGIETVTMPFIGNKMLSRFLENTKNNVFETRDFIEYVKKVALANPYIYNIELYSSRNDILITYRNEIIYKTFAMEIFDWYNNAIQAKGAPVWNNTYIYQQSCNIENVNVSLISISRQIRKNYFGEPLGVVNISIKESVIAEALRGIKLYPTQKVFIIDKDGLVLSNSDSLDISYSGKYIDKMQNSPEFKLFYKENKEHLFLNKNGMYESKIDNTDYVVLFNTVEINDWKLVSIVDKKELLSTFYTIKKYILAVSLIALIIGAVFIIIITGSIYKPILILKSAMQKAREGIFDVSITDKRKDEFSELYKSFNSMIETIDRLIKELYEKKLLATEAELKALQANIYPHFIYNIFESMIWMIELERLDDLKNMVMSLSRFYRLVLSEGKNIITVKEVAEQIENYINVQKIRYKDMLKVDIDIDTELYNYEMLNILLQPIIENAIIHGIEGKVGSGHVKIRGCLKENGLMLFTIEDDGIGIHKEKLDEIKKSLSVLSNLKNTKNEYYALKNINHRIKLHYGEEFGIDIESIHGQGTKVTLLIPTNKSLVENITQEVV